MTELIFELVVAVVALAMGAILQGSVGFGLGLVAAPVLALIAPRFVPGPLLFSGVLLALLILLRDRGSAHFTGLGWALAGRVPGAYLGALTLTVICPDLASAVLGVVVLFAVGMSLSGWRIQATAWTLLGAGTLSGYMATLTSIGGPPMALVYQAAAPDRLRGTLSGFFLVGTLISLLALTFHGRFGWDELRDSVLILPGTTLGFFLSRRTASILDRGYTRPAVLVVSALAAVACIVRQLV